MSGIIAQNTLGNSGLIKSPAAGGGAWTFIKKITASDSADVQFIDGTSDVVLDSTYKEYLFYFINVHHSELIELTFNVNVVGGSGFNETLTSTYFHIYHDETGAANALGYVASQDQAQGTGTHRLTGSIETVGGDDASANGWLHLFDISSTTFVKHFISRSSTYGATDYYHDAYTGGYFNTTSAIDEVMFEPQNGTGTIDSGDFILYGLTI